jgi:hypothetical protein
MYGDRVTSPVPVKTKITSPVSDKPGVTSPVTDKSVVTVPGPEKPKRTSVTPESDSVKNQVSRKSRDITDASKDTNVRNSLSKDGAHAKTVMDKKEIVVNPQISSAAGVATKGETSNPFGDEVDHGEENVWVQRNGDDSSQ